MDRFEKEIIYFNSLIFNNIQNAKTYKSKNKQFEMAFFNVNIRLDGEEADLYNQEKEEFYTIFKKDIENFTFENDVNKYLALYYMEKLTEYTNNRITFEDYADLQEETKTIVKVLLQQKKNIIEQLKLLRSHRNIPEVQEYIDKVCNDDACTQYVRYLIDKYYYNKKGLVKPKKTGLECWGKIILV